MSGQLTGCTRYRHWRGKIILQVELRHTSIINCFGDMERHYSWRDATLEDISDDCSKPLNRKEA